MNSSFQNTRETSLSQENSHQELGESLTNSAAPPSFRIDASGGSNPGGDSGGVAQQQTLLALNQGDERNWYEEVADWVRQQFNNDALSGSDLVQVLSNLRNDSRATYRLRVTYYNRYARNLLADIRLGLTRNNQQRWYEQVALAFNMTDEEFQRVLYEGGKIDAAKASMENFGGLTPEQREDMNADRRTPMGLEILLGTDARDMPDTGIPGWTHETEYGLNSLPIYNSGNIRMGSMDRRRVGVTVLDKAPLPDTEGANMYHTVIHDSSAYNEWTAATRNRLTQKQNAGNLSSDEQWAMGMMRDKRAWITSEGVEAVVPWSMFLDQLWAFENAFSDKSLQEKITILRQMAHPQNLPFDAVIGRPEGRRYQDTRPDTGSLFQLLKDNGKVITPHGEVVDIYHAIVGLDVLSNKIEDRDISIYGFSQNVGQNYSAALWSGDIGAGAADAALQEDSEWEAANTAGKSEEEAHQLRLNHYFWSRAPESDLWGDIDAWGMIETLENDQAFNIVHLMQQYYGQSADTGNRQKEGGFKAKRKRSLELFLAHYRNSGGGNLYPVFREQIEKFAVVWVRFRKQRPWASDDEVPVYSQEMAYLFTQWVLQQAKNYNLE